MATYLPAFLTVSGSKNDFVNKIMISGNTSTRGDENEEFYT